MSSETDAFREELASTISSGSRHASVLRRALELMDFFDKSTSHPEESPAEQPSPRVELLTADRNIFVGGQGVLPTVDKMIGGIHEADRVRTRMEDAIIAGDVGALALAEQTNAAIGELRELLTNWRPFNVSPVPGSAE